MLAEIANKIAESIASDIAAQNPYQPVCLMSLSAYGSRYYGRLDAIRAFRDGILIERCGPVGRTLVSAYYLSCSKLNRIFSQTPAVRKMFLIGVVVPLLVLFERLGFRKRLR